MEALKTLLLLAVVMVPSFFALHRLGFLVVKSGSFWGGAMGTPTRFWGNYRHLCGSVSKRFRISPKHSVLSLQLEADSGNANIEILLPGSAALYSWHFCTSLLEQVDCREIGNCTVRVTSENFAGKFQVSLE